MNTLASLAPAIDPGRLLPLVILSFVIGGLTVPRWALSIALLAAGLLCGALLPRLGIDRFFLPALYAVAGLALIGRREWLGQLLPPAAFIAGAIASYWTAQIVAATASRLTLFATAIALACIVSFLGYAVHRPWFSIPIRIVGSWFVAIGIIFAAVLLRPGEPPAVKALTTIGPMPVHDSNVPHIHGPNGEIIYLPTRGEGTTAMPGRADPMIQKFGNRVQP